MLGIYGARPLKARWLVENGQHSLGICLLHMIVMDFLTPLNPYLWGSVVWQLQCLFWLWLSAWPW